MKLVKITEEHYIVVDDSEIKEKSGDWFYSFETGGIYDTLIHHTAVSCKKITHSTQPLEDVGLNTSMGCQLGFDKIEPLSLQEVKELIGEVNVEKKAAQNTDTYQKELGYIQGYNQAIEDNKEKKYTEEQVKEACRLFAVGKTLDSCIKSLQPKTEWEVEFIDGKLKLK